MHGPDPGKDVGPKNKIQAGASNSEEIFRLLVDAVHDYAIFALDPHGVIQSWNSGGRRLKGYEASEVIGTHFSRFYTQPDIERNHPAFELREAVEKGKYEEEGWRVRKDGTQFWANVVITAMRDRTGHLVGFSKVTRDLTERKIAEDKLRWAYAELENRIEIRTRELSNAKAKAEKAVKARDEFFSMASHELKTPLSSLKLQAQFRRRQVLKGDLSSFAPEKLVELCDDDVRQVARLTFLVDNMLDVSKLTTGNFALQLQQQDLVALVRDVIKRMAVQLGESGNRCVLHSPVTLMGTWDRHRLEQVLSNLLSNAGKYGEGKPVEVTVRPEANLVAIEVRDQGRGISESHLQRIFSPFERVGPTHEVGGLGLGLYIAKQICDAHGGSIAVESKLGEGSVFRVVLPIETQPHSEGNA